MNALGVDTRFKRSSMRPDELGLSVENATQIIDELPARQVDVHSVYVGPIRWQRQAINEGVVVLTAHFIVIFDTEAAAPPPKQQEVKKTAKKPEKKPNKKGGKKKGEEEDPVDPEPVATAPSGKRGFGRLKKLEEIHLMDVTLIAYSEDNELLIRRGGESLRLGATGPCTSLEFGQLTYRNHQISFAVMDKKKVVLVKCDNMKLFPYINLNLSRSQEFQFLYFGLCSKHDSVYHHEVVQYIHSLVKSGSAIVDLSKIPKKVYEQGSGKEPLRPILHALSMMNFVSGICWKDANQPDLMDQIQHIMHEGSQVKIVHLVNCNAEIGLKKLEEEVRKRRKSPVRYWNLRGNPLQDFRSFVSVLKYTESLLLLDVSDCGVSAEDAKELFAVLAERDNLKGMERLSIAGMSFDNDAVQSFANYIEKMDQRSLLEAIDLSRIKTGVDQILQSLIDFPLKKLTHLILSDLKLSESELMKVCKIIKSSKTLRHLDISKTNITAEDLALVIGEVNDNTRLSQFELLMNDLVLHGDNWLPLFRAFLDGNGLESKWKSISLDRNDMSADDLYNAIPLLKMMSTLEGLSLAGNFDDSMKDIGQRLTGLLEIPNLTSICVAGGNGKSLKKELLPFVEQLRNRRGKQYEEITSIDVSGNEVGEIGYETLVTSLMACRGLKSVKIDGNSPTTVEAVTRLRELVDMTETYSDFEFPGHDCQGILKGIEDVDKRGYERERIADLQLGINDAVAQNREKHRLPPLLPFETSDEIEKLVNEDREQQMSRTSTMSRSNDGKYRHSLICEEFGLGLPNGSAKQLVRNRGRLEEGERNLEMERIYKAQLGKFIAEDEESRRAKSITGRLHSGKNAIQSMAQAVFKGPMQLPKQNTHDSDSVTPLRPTRRNGRKGVETSSSESYSEEDSPPRAKRNGRKAGKPRSSGSYSEEDSPPRAKRNGMKAVKPRSSESYSEEDSPPRAKRNGRKAVEPSSPDSDTRHAKGSGKAGSKQKRDNHGNNPALFDISSASSDSGENDKAGGQISGDSGVYAAFASSASRRRPNREANKRAPTRPKAAPRLPVRHAAHD